MTLYEFRELILSKADKRPTYLRLGQFVFNYIDWNYDVARIVQFQDGVDCFYRDDLIDEFIKCCYLRIYTPYGKET